jgi:site-specific DNA-methyltransferase (adenine-specific)
MNKEYPNSRDEWTTPPALLTWIQKNYGQTFDPCPINPTVDGLTIDWPDRNYVNPPYSEISVWAKKAYEEYLKGRFVAFLCFVRTDTQYFHNYLVHCSTIYLFEGRLRFGDGKGSATFPSMLCVFDPANKREYPDLRVIKKNDLRFINEMRL